MQLPPHAVVAPSLAACHTLSCVLAMAPSLDRHELLRRCEDLVPRLAARAEEAEELRQLPEATVEDARAADLFAAVVPTSLGGHGLGLEALAQSTRIMGQACPASAWTLSLLMMHGWLLSKLPAEGRAEVFAAGPVALAPAPLAPTGTVTVVDGGYRLTGRWEWATGPRRCGAVYGSSWARRRGGGGRGRRRWQCGTGGRRTWCGSRSR